MTKDEALRMAREALTWISDVYVHEDDEVGECASCHERSYRPHAPDCKRKLALDAIDAALAEPQGGMPELPPMTMTIAGNDPDAGHWYTADQMRDYGRACAEAARKADEALMRQALEALTNYEDRNYPDELIAAIRTRLGESHETR